jgi:hypothetical protein
VPNLERRRNANGADLRHEDEGRRRGANRSNRRTDQALVIRRAGVRVIVVLRPVTLRVVDVPIALLVAGRVSFGAEPRPLR